MYHPCSPPTAMLPLPNGNLLLGSEDGDSCVLKQSASSDQDKMDVSILHNPAPVWDFTVANLQQLPQPQVNP